ncbi:acyltransferase [Chitinophaga varians]|uniref:Acyltransferase n=1 Tax=Chitinophaga varians TaxID=2202339 RepID=A0A847S212_9BACT|nr:acyltransferase [Chitinophaga varians]NLR67128.1 acyltransferase [Chitinophaga varians]
MKVKLSILYAWLVRTVTLLLPNIPVFMRFRGFLYSLMMKRCGRNFQVTSTAILNSLSGLAVGNDVYIAHNCVLIGLDIEIGDKVLVGPNCIISSANHTFQDGAYRFGKSAPRAAKIGSGSWIAGNCSVVGGGVLPPMSVLGAGSVLNKPFTEIRGLYAGAPAVLIKKLQ